MILTRAALPGDCDEVAVMARELAAATSPGVSPKVSGDALRRDLFGPSPLLRLLVAEDGQGLVGYCLSLLLFSTWRGARGLHVIDLYLRPHARRGRLGERLLRAAARQGWQDGARFIRLEVESGNHGAERFYRRHGFHLKDNEQSYSLDEAPMRDLVAATGP
ncbi:MAG: GNAT family N-acetyltransferase [Hyphomicrobiaceae bacterium]